MLLLILSSVIFIGIHHFISGTRLRQFLVSKMGEQPYMGLFSLLSIAALAGMIIGFRQAPMIETWGQLTQMRSLAAVFMLLAFLFVTLGVLTRNRTGIGGEKHLQSTATLGIASITRHPFLVGVTIWSVTHIIFNGDLAALIFFGGFLLVALFGMASIDKKLQNQSGWQAFEQQTSILPFMAIIQGRGKLDLKGIGIIKPIIAVIVFMGFFHSHIHLFGVAPIIRG